MQLKNLATGVALPLPDDLLWADEHAWSPAVASTSYLITGALLIQSATRQAGRPITLVGAPDMAWVTRAAVEQLRAWAALAVSEATGRFELTLTDAWVWDVYRSARFVKQVRVVTFKDVNVEELAKADLQVP